jgi:hypothetical protein
VSRFSAAGKTLATAANSNILSIRSTATQRAMIEELYVYAEAATAWLSPALFLTTVVDTAGTAVVLQKEDNGSGAASVTVVTIPTGGTLAAVAHKRASLPAVIGSGFIWSWPPGEGLVVPVSLSAMLRNDGVIGPAITWGLTVREV